VNILSDSCNCTCIDCGKRVPHTGYLCNQCEHERREAIEHLSPDDNAGWGGCWGYLLPGAAREIFPERVPRCGERVIYERAMACRWCKQALHRYGPDEPWLVSMLGGIGESADCAECPNPEDGPMPGHEPGTKPVRNPDWKD
jgi:hypothetical protein